MNSEDIFQIVIPTEEEIEISEGKRHAVAKRIFPGYLLVQMRMNAQSWDVVRNTPGVTGFVGAESRPMPLREGEAEAILGRMEAKVPRVKVGFSKGERVRICDGPFVDFVGMVDDIHPSKGRARVLVSFFGRETSIDLDFLQLERL
jgi:transcriptional antiterminator NusG